MKQTAKTQAIKILMATCLLGLSVGSFAKTVPVKFAKGSYSGNFVGRTFTLTLNAGQTLTVDTAENVDNVIVRDPRGRALRFDG